MSNILVCCLGNGLYLCFCNCQPAYQRHYMFNNYVGKCFITIPSFACLCACIQLQLAIAYTSPVYHKIANWLTNTFKLPGQMHHHINSDCTHCPLCVHAGIHCHTRILALQSTKQPFYWHVWPQLGQIHYQTINGCTFCMHMHTVCTWWYTYLHCCYQPAGCRFAHNNAPTWKDAIPMGLG